MVGHDRRDDEAREPCAGSDDRPSGGGVVDATWRGSRTITTGMKKLAAVLAVLVGVSIPYVIAQQPLEVPVIVPPAPVALVATDHPPLPKDISQYWFVPGPGSAAGASK